MDKTKIKYLWAWNIIIILQFFILVIDILFFKKFHPIWLLLGAFLLILGLYLPMQDREVKEYYTKENNKENKK